ncbi:DUF4843 domain-containing protein [Niabella hibiscisoli]|uniref:DUF4843 domain-containing protein n=1 Tax=Niabella hibiscisoli TaxID=1825928 RepID=UPI001F10E0D9|nr:DUF4843 domain-containing protein [Niabella hibiscisoli]MCH5720108.1 DUF4843 domain-containing protein [Niabella hibiscisoli]
MKKTYLKRFIYTVLLALSLTSCKEDQSLIYEQDARIYFREGVTADYSFTAEPASVVTDTLFIPLRIMGSAVDRDRIFNIIIDDSSTAKRGYHFQFGPLVIPANTYELSLPVYIYRKPGLKDSVVNAYLTIGESEDFKPGYIDKSNSINPYNKQHYRISLNDQLLKPSSWDTRWATYFGTYSRTKHQFINQTYGSAAWPAVVFPQDINFVVQTMKLALYNYEQANGPLIDENGERVVFL